jgi:hypothetical protein
MIRGYKTLQGIEAATFCIYPKVDAVIPSALIKYTGIHFDDPVTKLGTLIVDCSTPNTKVFPTLFEILDVDHGCCVLMGCINYLSSQGCCEETGITHIRDLSGYYISEVWLKYDRNYSIVLENIAKYGL